MDNSEALIALYDAEVAGLTRVAILITGSRESADDIVHEAFARAAERWRRVSRYDKPGAWLRLVVVRLAVRARAARDRTDVLDKCVAFVHTDPAMPDPELTKALLALGWSPRACVVLHHVEGYSVVEVARILEMPEGTVRSHLHRGRAALARQLAGGTYVEAAD